MKCMMNEACAALNAALSDAIMMAESNRSWMVQGGGIALDMSIALAALRAKVRRAQGGACVVMVEEWQGKVQWLYANART